MRKRQRQIIIRVTEDEANIFKTRLAKTKLKQNNFAIKCLLNHPVYAIENMQDLLLQLKALGNNLNQIARAINSGKTIPPPAISELAGGVNELWRFLKLLKVVKV